MQGLQTSTVISFTQIWRSSCSQPSPWSEGIVFKQYLSGLTQVKTFLLYSSVALFFLNIVFLYALLDFLPSLKMLLWGLESFILRRELGDLGKN